MKKLTKLLLVTVAAFALALTDAAAQLSIQSTSLNGGTANVAAATTNAVTTPLLSVTRSSNVAIMASFKLTGSGTSAVVFNFDASVDGSTWVANQHTLSVTAAGTGTVQNLAKIAVNGVGYLRLSSVENPNASAITNLVLKYSFKPGQ